MKKCWSHFFEQLFGPNFSGKGFFRIHLLLKIYTILVCGQWCICKMDAYKREKELDIDAKKMYYLHHDFEKHPPYHTHYLWTD